MFNLHMDGMEYTDEEKNTLASFWNYHRNQWGLTSRVRYLYQAANPFYISNNQMGTKQPRDSLLLGSDTVDITSEKERERMNTELEKQKQYAYFFYQSPSLLEGAVML